MPKSTEDLQAFCRALPAVTEDVKWGDNLVFSVGGKMFSVFDLLEGGAFSFKVEPLVFSSLVGHEGIEPAPYLARHHWVQLKDRETLPTETLEDFFTESHRLVAAKLPKRRQRELGLLDE